MHKRIFLIFTVIFSINHAIAHSEDYDIIIQKQSEQIQELKNQILRLETTIEEMKNEIEKSDTITYEYVAAGNLMSGELVNDSSISNVQLTDHKAAKKLIKNQDKSAYDLALATLKNGRFVEAEKQFFDFIENYPSSDLQSNAMFWYSETFYHRNIYDKAAINYLKGYKKYPNGSKAADSLLRLAYSLGALNKNKEACSILEKLDIEFPKRPISSIKRTNDAKVKFNCK